MFRVLAKKPSNVTAEQANQAVQTWKEERAEWVDPAADHKLTVVPLTDSDDYLRGEIRFESSENLYKISSQMEADLQEVVGWYRIGYYRANYDNVERDSGWDATYEYGDIPSEVPDFEIVTLNR
jgi:hypothetical protein